MTSPPSADGVWRKLRLVPQLTAPDLALQADDLAAVVVEGGMLRWVGPTGSVPAAYAALPQFDGGGALATPGLVDCHTHLVYGGQRANEFAMRLAGASYEEVAHAGGGIVSSVRATRAATRHRARGPRAPGARLPRLEHEDQAQSACTRSLIATRSGLVSS